MKDRVSVHPGRVKLTPVAGEQNTYDMVRADSPTQEGTPLNKNTILKDTTAALYGLGTDAVPDDVLSNIKALVDGANSNANGRARIQTGSYVGTGTIGESNPNRLTFDFEPKTVIISGFSQRGGVGSIVLVASVNSSFLYYSYDTMFSFDSVKWNQNTIEWYTELNGYGYQANDQGRIYYYICIG